jgi:hypothetical protein
VHYEIEQDVNLLGLLERKGKGKYDFISDKSELQTERLYYLYFKDKSDRISSPGGNDEETKKVCHFHS